MPEAGIAAWTSAGVGKGRRGDAGAEGLGDGAWAPADPALEAGGAGLPALDPKGVPVAGERCPGGFNFNFFDPESITSLLEGTLFSISLPGGEPGPLRARFFDTVAEACVVDGGGDIGRDEDCAVLALFFLALFREVSVPLASDSPGEPRRFLMFALAPASFFDAAFF